MQPSHDGENMSTGHVEAKLARALETQCDLMKIWCEDHGRFVGHEILLRTVSTTLARFLKRTLIRLFDIVGGKSLHALLLECS